MTPATPRAAAPRRTLPRYHDCFHDDFATDGKTWFSSEKFGLRMLGIDTYDTIGNGSFAGLDERAQFAFVRDELARDPDQPDRSCSGTTPSPSTRRSSARAAGGLRTRHQLRRHNSKTLYAANPGVFLHHAGHTHRNKRAIFAAAPGVVFQEVAAIKEYPGRVPPLACAHRRVRHELLQVQATSLAQEWTERSRPEYLGAAPLYLFGNTADRNSVTARDLSGLQSAEAARAARRYEAGDVLPATGATSRPAVTGAAAAAAATAAAWLRRQAKT